MYLWTPYFGSTRHFGVSIKTRFFGCHGFDVIFVIYVIAKLSITKALNTNASDQATKCWAHARSDPNIFRSITDLYPQKKMVQSSGTVGNEIVYSLLFRVHAYQNHSKHTRTHVWSRALAHTHTHCQCILYRVYSTRSKQTTLKQNKKNLGTDTNRAEVMRVQIAWPIDNYWSR